MLSVTAIPAFTDNYIWAIHDNAGHAVVVDPGDAQPVETWLRDNAASLCGILITHHHWDHTGGIAALSAVHQCPVYGPDNPQIQGITQTCGDGQTLNIDAPALSLQVLAVPGHTLDHLAYYAPEQGLLFCGDTLFHAGCGRLFEGSAAQMHASLQRLAELPADTRVYCTHEYTEANLRFALAVEPGNLELQQCVITVEQLRANGRPSLPSTLELQRAINPFLRCDQRAVITAAQQRDPATSTPDEVFATLRTWKDTF